MSEKLASLTEAATVETERLIEEEEQCSSLPFYHQTLAFYLIEFPKRFGHIPELMKAFKKALKECRINPKRVEDCQLRQRNFDLECKLTGLISNYFKPTLERQTIEMASLLFTNEDLESLQSMGEAFLKRDDLEWPSEFNALREFSVKIGGIEYRCQMVVSPGGDRGVSFIFNDGRGKKFTPMIALNPSTTYHAEGLSQTDIMVCRLYEIAKNMVAELEKLEGSRTTVGGIVQRHGVLNVAWVISKLAAENEAKAKATDEVGTLPPSRDLGGIGTGELAALATHFPYLQDMQHYLNAMDFVALSVFSEEELSKIVQNRAAFIVHVMVGIMRLFKHVMSIGSSGKPDILAGLSERDRLLIKLNGGTNGGEQAAELAPEAVSVLAMTSGRVNEVRADGPFCTA